MLVTVPAVRDDDPRIGRADERTELLAVAALGDLKERGGRGARAPQRAALAAGAPAGLIDRHRALVQHPVLQLAVRAGQRLGGSLADRIDRAGRQRDAEQVPGELADPSARDSMPGGQRHDRRLQPRPERAAADRVWQSGAGPCATVPAAQLVSAMLGPNHADRRQLRDLAAAEPPARPALLFSKLPSASTAPIRIVIDDLIHLILRLELATRTPMPRLTARLTRLALPTHQLLRLGPRLRPPLRPRLRRIRRRRLRTRPRLLARLGL
jgi:hypothetical protein